MLVVNATNHLNYLQLFSLSIWLKLCSTIIDAHLCL